MHEKAAKHKRFTALASRQGPGGTPRLLCVSALIADGSNLRSRSLLAALALLARLPWTTPYVSGWANSRLFR